MIGSKIMMSILEELELWKRGSMKACMIIYDWVTSVL